jgi:hypothetical protein
VAEVASAPVEPRAEGARGRLRVSPWRALVAASLVIVLGGTAVFVAGWLATGQTHTRAYSVRGQLLGVQLRVVRGDVVLLGGAQSGVAVRRTDHSTFGHGPLEWRRRVGGVLEIASTCPRLVAGDCGSSYRIAVPDNVPVSVRADHGSIRVEGYRGSASLATGDGRITVDAFCGYTLRATSVGGDILAAGSCAPESVELRSTSGNITARVPAGRYRVDAAGGGAPVVRGLTVDPNAPWEIQALSTTGDVVVEAGS